MAVTITHAYVATGTDAGNGEVHKSQWNAAHTVSNAADVTATNSFSAQQNFGGTFDAGVAGSTCNIKGSGSYGGGITFLDTNYSGIYTQNSGGELRFFANQTTGDTAASKSFMVASPSGFGLVTGNSVGGTVTQATSKTTGVTLNKPSGSITMNSAALANGAVANFVLTNSCMSLDDFALVILNSGASNSNNYRIEADSKAAGALGIRITNISGSSKSEAVVIDFLIIKGALS